MSICYAYGLLLTHTRSTYRLITILTVYETARAYPGITPYVYPFLFYLILCSFHRGSRLMHCTKYEMVDGSASEALQAYEQYMEMYTLLCTVQETFTLLCTVHSVPHRS